jgi:hypothetical protein
MPLSFIFRLMAVVVCLRVRDYSQIHTRFALILSSFDTGFLIEEGQLGWVIQIFHGCHGVLALMLDRRPTPFLEFELPILTQEWLQSIKLQLKCDFNNHICS